MADVINLGRSVRRLRASPAFPAVSAIRMVVSDNKSYEVGDDSGYKFEIESPWATQEQASWLLGKMQGLEYAPYEVDTGLLRPEAELGDYVSIRGIFGGLMSEDITFGKNYTASFGSPADEEVDSEYKFEGKTDREIRQKVSKKSPEGNETFGWDLQDDQWKIFNQDGDIFRVSATGAWLKGHLDITEGSININNTFTVDANGNLYATSGTFEGNVYAKNIKANVDPDSGVNYGTFSGSGLTGGSVGYAKTTSSVQSNLDQVWTNQSDIVAINNMFAGTLGCNNLTIAHSFKLGSLNITTGTVGGQTNVLYGYL